MTSTGPVRDRLAAAVVAGRQLDLLPGTTGTGPLDEQAMRGWGPDHDLAAEDLFDLLHARGLPGGAVAHPSGVRLRGARITGRLVLDFVTDALPLHLVDCLLDDGITAYAAHLPELDLQRCRISHPTAIPFDAETSRIDHGLRLRDSIISAAHDTPYAADLTGAHVGHSLVLTGARLTNPTGPALNADRCEIGGALFLTDGFSAEGAGKTGTVRLLGARITGQLNARNARLTNPTGPALNADGCEIGGGLFLTDGFTAEGTGKTGTVQLRGARISGRLTARGATLTNTTATALDLRSAQVDGGVFLDGTFRARGAGTRTAVDLTDARLGVLSINDRVTHATDPHARWQLDGCTYTGLPQPDDRARWLALLREATPAYAAQPYQQLAAAHRAAGHDGDVREILIAQRRDQIRRGRLGLRQQAWARFTGVALGFGWKPWRALHGLAAVFAVSVILAVVLGGHGALVHPPRPGAPVEPCTVVERVGVGLDLGTPLLGSTTRSRDRCPINPDPASATATALTVSTWVLQFTAWGLAALFVAGFTGAVRKT